MEFTEVVAFIIIPLFLFGVPIFLIKSLDSCYKSNDKPNEDNRATQLADAIQQAQAAETIELSKSTSIAEQLRQACNTLKDVVLIKNAQEVAKDIEEIGAMLLKYPNAKIEELVREHSMRLLGLLSNDSLSTKEDARQYARELVVEMQGILETLCESNADIIDVEIDVFRKDMRMRGLVR